MIYAYRKTPSGYDLRLQEQKTTSVKRLFALFYFSCNKSFGSIATYNILNLYIDYDLNVKYSIFYLLWSQITGACRKQRPFCGALNRKMFFRMISVCRL